MENKTSEDRGGTDCRITNVESVRELWTKTYNTAGKPDWSHIIPYYADDIVFRDTVQGLQGIKEFTE
jgi:hypothetical protein